MVTRRKKRPEMQKSDSISSLTSEDDSFGIQDSFVSGISTDLQSTKDTNQKRRENVAQAIWAHLDPFVYDQDCTLYDSEMRDIVELEDGSQYQGEWLLHTDLRQGQGH